MRIALDSNVFMYALSSHPVWGKAAYDTLKLLQDGRASGVASCVCLAEVIAQPAAVSQDLGEQAQLFMEGIEGLDYFQADLETGIVAGRLRAKYGPKLRTPDALHLATALIQKADLFITNDHTLLKLKLDGLRIHLLGEPLG